MRILWASWRLLRAAVHALHGLAVALLVLPSAGESVRQARVQWWSGKMLRLLQIDLQVDGQFRTGAQLVVANHISWLDILAIHAVYPQARFVSKADVQSWPVLGRLVDAGGTLYIQREKRRDAMRVVHQMADALAAGEVVAVFPEGTTADGLALLPFHANLLQAAISTEVPIQPVALRYSDARHPISQAAQFVGETTLAQSLWKVASAERLVVRVRVLTAVSTSHADRRALALHLQQLIEAALQPSDQALP